MTEKFLGQNHERESLEEGNENLIDLSHPAFFFFR